MRLGVDYSVGNTPFTGEILEAPIGAGSTGHLTAEYGTPLLASGVGDQIGVVFKTRQAIGDVSIFKHHVRTPLGDAIILRHNTRQNVSDSLQLKHNVLVAGTPISPVSGQVYSGETTSSNSIGPIHFSSNTANNNLIVAVIGTFKYNNPSFTIPTNWVMADQFMFSNAIGKIGICYRVGGAENDWTFSNSGGSGGPSMWVWIREFTGNLQNQSTVLDKIGHTDSAFSTVASINVDATGPTNGNTSQGRELAVVGVAGGGAQGTPPTWGGTGFSNEYWSTNGYGAASRILSSIQSPLRATFTWGAGSQYLGGVIASFKAA